MSHAMRYRRLLAGLAAGLGAVAAASAGGPAGGPAGAGLECWPSKDREAYAAYEAALNAVPTRDSLLATHQLLASEPHVAGTPGDLRNVDRLAKAFEEMGLTVERHEFWAYLCRPVSAAVEVMEPEHIPLLIKEQTLPQDEFSGNAEQMIGWNAYSGSGDVTAGIVYANYGTKADFEKLKELGVDPKGKIVLCRYGGNFRGYKAKFAQDAGAAGVIIFTDPADSGYTKGITYPEGGYANSTCIERGSIDTLPYPGDPLTPGREATEHAERLDPATVDLPKIPVQPISYGQAQKILEHMTGPGVPEKWQGGLPLAYRLTGGDQLKVRLKVEQERKITPSFNVIGKLQGASDPDHLMIIGCHHDAWGCGAADPLAGTIALLESAKSFAAQAKAGHPPARTILFAAWGAEEYGMVGSTEWVESRRDQLVKNAVAYINLDMASMGVEFGASTSPSLRAVIEEASMAVPAARRTDGKPVFEEWLARGEDALVPKHPKFGDLGGGSDHIAFLCYAGVPSTSLGGGGSKGTSYHSTYDTLPWYWKVVGEDYEPALMVTRMTSAVAGRLASAPLLPLRPARYGVEVRRQLIDITKRAAELGVIAKPEREIAPELARLEGAALQFDSFASGVEQQLLAAEEAGIEPAKLARINGLLIDADRAWLSEDGVPGRPWFKNLYASSDEDSGYAAWTLPLLRWAVEHKDRAALTSAEDRYLKVLASLRTIMERIDGELK